MKALICSKYGPPEDLFIGELPVPGIEAGQVLIRVVACGINFPDILIIEGQYQFKPDFPFSPGAEVYGIIEAVSNDVKELKVGDRVVSGTTWGGLAEYVVGKASNTFPVSAEISSEKAAAFLMTYGTSYHALVDRGQLKSSEVLLVLGAAGGVGVAAIQIAKVIGCKVIAAASTHDKLSFCKSNGADELINYEDLDLKSQVKALTKGKGVDVIYDPVGGHYSETAFRSIARYGRYLIVGFAAGSIPSIPLNLPLLKSASIVGAFWGSFFRNEPEANAKNVEKLIQWLAGGKIKPQIDKVFTFKESISALNLVKDRKVKGKVVVTI